MQREPDFLPEWYARARRERLLLRAQCAALAVVLLAVGGHATSVVARAVRAEGRAAGAAAQLRGDRQRLVELDQQLALRGQLARQSALMGRIGVPLEMTRVLGELARALPANAALLSVDARIETTLPTLADRARRAVGAREPRPTSELAVAVEVAAPTESEGTLFYSRLADRPHLVAFKFLASGERTEAGRLVRHTNFGFRVPLTRPEGYVAPQAEPSPLASVSEGTP